MKISKLPFLICLSFLYIYGGISSGIAQVQSTEATNKLATEEVLIESMVAAGVGDRNKDPVSGLPAVVLDPEIDPQELEYRLVPLTKAELAILTKTWLTIVKSKTEEVMAAQIAIYKTNDNIEDAARTKLTELTHERRALFDKYSKIISAWEKKGGDPEEIQEFKDYESAILVEETRTADFKTLVAQARAWLVDRDGGVDILIDVLIFIAAFVCLLIVAGVIRRFARYWFKRIPNFSTLLQVFLVTVIYWMVIAFGLMVVLLELGVDITPAFALIGGASFIMAFAFQDTLGNLASGMMIMVNQPFDQGDYVEIGGVGGSVKKVSIVATTVVTPDNQIIVIPNKNVWGNIITNVTASDTRRVDLVFGISYGDSIPQAAELIKKVVTSHPLVLKDPAPNIRVHELADSSVNFICRPWTKTIDYWTVHWDLTQQMKEQFDEAGISIPFPQREVHVHHGIDAGAYLNKIVPTSKTTTDANTQNKTKRRRAISKAKATAQGEGNS